MTSQYSPRSLLILGIGIFASTAALVTALVSLRADDPGTTTAASEGQLVDESAVVSLPEATTLPAPAEPTPTQLVFAVSTPVPYLDGWVDPASVGRPYGTVNGLLTFRGNPTRTFYGSGPMPRSPKVSWRFGGGQSLCSKSTVGAQTTDWCGTGWTGQPAIFDYEGERWVVFGSFAPAVHFLSADTGERLIADYPVGDLIKGSVTIDPDGYPLVYVGSRDGFFRIISFDQGEPVELWSLSGDAVEPTLWNDDWDGTPLVLDDHLFVGGENSQWHAVKLNRRTSLDGTVSVAPELVYNAPGWDDDLLAAIGDENVSIETAITVVDDQLWFANSGGLVQAWDIEPLRTGIGEPERIFRFWTGDDTDASIVIDAEGYAYVGVELERAFSRGVELGQVIKLDPRRPDDPVVWSRDLHVRVPDGIWATPALHRDVVYVPTSEGWLHALDAETGETRWSTKLQGPVWSSPVVVDNVLLQADCAGFINAWDVSDTTRQPEQLWSLALPWCIESTPAVWDGLIVVGHRRGEVVALRD